MKKLYYKVLSFFEFCDHKYSIYKGLKIVEVKSKLITVETFSCEKCESEMRKYYIQEKP